MLKSVSSPALGSLLSRCRNPTIHKAYKQRIVLVNCKEAHDIPSIHYRLGIRTTKLVRGHESYCLLRLSVVLAISPRLPLKPQHSLVCGSIQYTCMVDRLRKIHSGRLDLSILASFRARVSPLTRDRRPLFS